MITISAFKWVPPFAQGLVRDLRVRWALEEAGLAYREKLIDQEDQKSEAYRSLQPFGQVPTFEDGGLKLFESGSIVLHIAERSDALMPAEPDARSRVKMWLFTALNTIEPHIMYLAEVDLFHAKEDWAKQRRPAVVKMIQKRLKELSAQLRDREYLEGRFTVADLLMTTVLRIPRNTTLVQEVPVLDAYRLRCEARPAFKKALDAQMAVFAKHAPPIA